MNSKSSFSNINISQKQKGLPYYQDMLKLFWSELKRSKMYEYDLVHGYTCICCSKILLAGNDKEKEKLSSKREKRYIE